MPESEWQDSKDRGDNKERQSMFERALEFAMKAHRGQVRKGSSVPYIVHPIETALIVMTLSDDQDVIIAALFHDVIEDTKYGAKESENKRRGEDKSATWKIRKQEFIDSLSDKPKEEKVIALADKLSNMRATYQGYRKNGEAFWDRFHEKRKGMHAWYYRSVADRLREFEHTDAWKELDGLISKVFADTAPS